MELPLSPATHVGALQAQQRQGLSHLTVVNQPSEPRQGGQFTTKIFSFFFPDEEGMRMKRAKESRRALTKKETGREGVLWKRGVGGTRQTARLLWTGTVHITSGAWRKVPPVIEAWRRFVIL